MEVYLFWGGGRMQGVRQLDFDRYFTVLHAHGRSFGQGWVPLPIRVEWDADVLALGPPEQNLDFPGSGIIFSRRAVECLRGLLGNCEILALECEQGEYYWINVLTVLPEDALDPAGIETYYLDDSKLRYNVKEYIFRPSALKAPIFKLTQYKGDLVTSEFVDAIRAHGLTGFVGKIVWEDGAAVQERPGRELEKLAEMPLDEILARPSVERLRAIEGRLVSRASRPGTLDTFGEAEWALFRVIQLEYEVGNGGFEQYFRNRGDEVRADLAALERLGAQASVAIVKKALRPFGKAGPKPDPAEREAQVRELRWRHGRSWEQRSTEFMVYPDRLPRLKFEFLEQNVAEFR